MRYWQTSLLIVVLFQLGDANSSDTSDQFSHSAAEVSSACKRTAGAGSAGGTAAVTECGPPPPTGRKVCGTDNTTYDSVCLLRLARCQGRAVELRHRGPCKDPQPCLADLNRYYLRLKGQPTPVVGVDGLGGGTSRSSGRKAGGGAGERQATPESSTYLPMCRKDGTYAAVQCHNLTGYCWCVTRRGRFVKGSTVKGSRPKCARAMKTRRGSSPGHRLHKRGCGHRERSTFNSNLIKIFRQDLEQSGDVNVGTDADDDFTGGAEIPVDAEGDAGSQDPNRRVLDWKFAALDADKDGILRRSEYADLRRLVRKVVRPKRCARTFGRLCDLDRDRNISRQEWAACFGLDFSMLQESVRPSDSALEQPHRDRQRGGPLLLKDDDEGNIGELDGRGIRNDPKIDLQERAIFPLDRDRSDNSDAEATDCITDRQAVLDEQRSSAVMTHDPYVPECTPDGRYQRKQCYNSTGYCWCVNEDSGKPIPGTSVKHQNPSCDIEKIQPRPFMGCPEPAKQIFLENLIEFLRSEMSLTPEKTGPSVLKSPEDEAERIVTWTFAKFDVNKNKVLERREWKDFRQKVSTRKQLRRCGKKLPRHCDVNHDRKISMTEWLDCTRPREGVGVGKTQHWPMLSAGQLGLGASFSDDSSMAHSGISSNVRANPNGRGSRRKGLNPLERYLKP